MLEYLEFTADKFRFRVATDRLYTRQGVWAQVQANNRVRVGLGDYLQQSSGDVAFASVKPVGTKLTPEATFAEIETIKTLLEAASPVTGTVVEVNPALRLSPEATNQDPYGEGWLAVIEAGSWESDRSSLLEPSAYFALMQSQVKADLNNT